jgi:hypothetical protein
MHEWKDIEKSSSSGKQLELDKRLAAYYGPELREQPLSSASWQRLRSQLNTRRSTRHRQRSHLRGRWHRRQSFVPAYVQETFSRISYEARVPYPQSLLQCSLNTRVYAPSVRISTLGRHKIKLVLPSIAEGAIGQPGLDVLVAAGLARYLYARRPEHIITRVLMLFAVLLAFTALLMFWRQNHLVIVFPVVVIPCIPLLLHMQGRRLAFRADSLIVLWLGRERTCRGLHALAARTPSSSRRTLGEPSLVERIHRVCGNHVAVEEERLTLVR